MTKAQLIQQAANLADNLDEDAHDWREVRALKATLRKLTTDQEATA